MTYKGHLKAANRAFDHLYDPLFVTADIRDVHRENVSALNRTAPVNIYPVYENMFTDLPQCPRNLCALQQNPLPVNPSFGEKKMSHRPATVSGSERYKYFSLPINNTKTINLNLDPIATEPFNDQQQQAMAGKFNGPPYRTVGCQTVYREQSAQTRPFQPLGIVRSGIATPEIMHIVDLIENDNLPGLYEADIIERARRRRKCEMLLKQNAQSNDDCNQNCLMLEALEWADWLAREGDLEQCQQLRLEIVQRLLDNRHHNIRLSLAAQMKRSVRRLESERERKLDVLYNNHNRTMRQLNNNLAKLKNVNKPRSIADEYLDYGSNLYGPQSRFGHHPRNSNFTRYITDYEARLDALHKSAPSWKNLSLMTKLRPKIDEPKTNAIEFSRGFWDEKNLQKIYHSLKALRLKSNVHQEIAQCLKRIKQSRSARSCNINDTYGCPSSRTSSIANTNQFLESQQSLLASLLKKECETHTVLEQTDDTTATNLLHQLDKQISKLMDQKKSHAIYLLAEKQHNQHDLTDDKIRTIHEIKQKEHSEMYRNILQAHNDSSIFYLENVLMQCYTNIAETDARDKIRSIAEKVDKEIINKLPIITEVAMEAMTRSSSADAIANVMENYLLPDILSRLDGHIKRKQLTVNLNNPSDPYDSKSCDSDNQDSLKVTYNMRGEIFATPKEDSTLVAENMLHDILQNVSAETEDDKRNLLLEIIGDLYDKIENIMDDNERYSYTSSDVHSDRSLDK